MNRGTLRLIGYAFLIIGVIMLVLGYFETVYVFAGAFAFLIIGILLLVIPHALTNRADDIKRDEDKLT